jgi:L-threonylcarbamoyladenylate synthase
LISQSIDEAVEALLLGGVIAAPTDTLYGVMANALNEDAVARVFATKGRVDASPLPIFVSRVCELYNYGRDIPDIALRLAERFWPGKLTIVVRRSEQIPSLVSGGLGTVGVRIPNHPVPRAIVGRLGAPVTATSANLSGAPPLTSGSDVAQVLGRALDLVYDGGQLAPSPPSTVVDVTVQPPKVLREGAVSRASLERVAGVTTGV